jgi:alanine racemase
MTAINQATITENGILRPTHVEVNLDRLAENLRIIRQLVKPAKVLVILKANAYGHGLVAVARQMDRSGADYLGVAYLEEGVLLREAGISTPILVLGGILGNQVPHFLDYDLTLTASSVEKMKQIEAAAKATGRTARVHLKIDTGMERIGVHYYSARPLLEAALRSEHCHVEGIYSHFANSDTADLSHARKQLSRFEEVLDFYTDRGVSPPLRHIANSGAILQMPESYMDMVRAGILLYGLFPSDEVPRTLPIRPALTWKSRVVYFKVVKPGHPVGYGSTWEADEMTRVVTIPVGYGDGYCRALSNRSEVIIRGKRYPIIGRVCMDQMMVNIGWETAYNGDDVVLLGEGEGQTITPEEMAGWAGTNPYEILTSINTRVPRVYLPHNAFSPSPGGEG